MPLVRRVLTETLSELQPTDSVSIVSYAADARTRLAPTPVSDSAKIQRVIDSLEAGGSTNGASGIDLAYRQAQAGFLDDGINHVILCTDGDFNVGITSSDELVRFIEQKRTPDAARQAAVLARHRRIDRLAAGDGYRSILFRCPSSTARSAFRHNRYGPIRWL